MGSAPTDLPTVYDLPTSMMCLLMAVMLFGLYAMTNPKNRIWLTLPWYVRLALCTAGVSTAVRGAELFSLAQPSGAYVYPGHINTFGFVSTCAFTFLFSALALYAVLQRLPPEVRAKLEWFEHLARCKPREKGVAMATLAMQGVKVVPPRGGLPPE